MISNNCTHYFLLLKFINLCNLYVGLFCVSKYVRTKISANNPIKMLKIPETKVITITIGSGVCIIDKL